MSSKSDRSEITLDELSDLYRCEEEEQQLRAERRKSVLAPNSNQVVQLRVSASRDDLSCAGNGKLHSNNNNNVNRQSKKINRLSCKILTQLFNRVLSSNPSDAPDNC